MHTYHLLFGWLACVHLHFNVGADLELLVDID